MDQRDGGQNLDQRQNLQLNQISIATWWTKEGLSLEEQIPKEYHEYLDVFDKDKADWFPSSWSWDHKIELKEGFQPKSFKSYNLTPEEQTELDKFLKDNLEKKYIRPSQSPMASP